jgi:ribonuclease P protein subunit RPR2
LVKRGSLGEAAFAMKLNSLPCFTTVMMGMPKAKSKGSGVPNRQAHARTSFLHQAAMYLATLPDPKSLEKAPNKGKSKGEQPSKLHQNSLAAYLALNLKTVSLKSQAKLSRHVKRTICKRCNTPLVPEQTAISRIENPSRNGRKPWADCLVTTCLACGMQKRYPLSRKPDLVSGEAVPAKELP